ncbi:hypothetical protein [Williamsia phyllosphaerae]|uniref:Uncharacterized protein n=1 Tax=Williamsia phyllosphaerae TaxID=885042 RepID=A0ABQ1UT49_9NOCA|nr:hypothetical protein [Williamsia phyllosphaerae]GGF24626.1 hypothetical protein GCM10007298_20670 [Williamsia phyllosphaerae]
MAIQLRSHRLPGGRQAADPVAESRTLAELVAAAAKVAPTVPAVCMPDVDLSLGELAQRATGASMAMSGGNSIDDSALTVALMMTIPGLAASGASGLATTLSSVRIQATMAVAGSRQA